MNRATTRSALWEIAIEQHGFVTAAQAREEGFSKAAVNMLISRGKLERSAWGVYRFPEIPVSQYDQLALAVLWTGASEACLSHETALDCYGICDINPSLVHLSVKTNRRIRRSGGDDYIIHYETLSKTQVGWWERIPITKPFVAIEQCIRYRTPTYLLDQAIENGCRNGFLKKREADELREELEKRSGE